MTDHNRIWIENRIAQAFSPHAQKVMEMLKRVPYRTPEQEHIISLPRQTCVDCGKINFWPDCECQDAPDPEAA